jgi:arabinofuranosyltransferase
LSGVADERSFYRDEASLVLSSRNRAMPTHAWGQLGREVRGRNEKVFVHDNIGFLGFNAGPGVHIIDQLALSEPLLARLPMRYRSHWRVGHYARQLPEGYREQSAAPDGPCVMKDLKLCEYYAHLREVIAGPLFSVSRIKTLIAMNLGLYDSLIDRERYRYPDVDHATLPDLSLPVAERAGWNSPGTRVIPDDGLMIDLPEPSHAKRMYALFDGNDGYVLEFRNDTRVVGRLESKAFPTGLMRTRKFDVPATAQQAGFDHILIRPDAGDGMYSVAFVRLRDK